MADLHLPNLTSNERKNREVNSSLDYFVVRLLMPHFTYFQEVRKVQEREGRELI